MSDDERKFLDDLRAKSIEAAAEIMESLQRLKLLYDEITDDGSGGAPARPRIGDFFYQLARFELEHASKLIRLGNSQAEMIFDHVRQLARRTKGGAAVPTAVVTLEYTPKRDGQDEYEYRGCFEIKNPFAGEADPRFAIGVLCDANGTETGWKPVVTCSSEPVRGYQSARIDIVVPDRVDNRTLFGEITVFLSAEIERQVARRAIKLRPAHALREGERE